MERRLNYGLSVYTNAYAMGAESKLPQTKICLQRTYIGISRKRLKYTYLLVRLEFSNSSAPCTCNIIIQRFAAGVTVHTR